MTLNATDTLDTTEQGNITMQKSVRLELPEGLEASEVLLNGYSIQMKCADSECAEGDAVWPFKFNIKVFKVSETDYTLTVEIHRGQTESKERLGKHIHFDVLVPLKVFFFNEGRSAQSISKTYYSRGQTTDKNGQYSVHVAKFNKDLNASSVVVGLTNIGFEIEYDKKY